MSTRKDIITNVVMVKRYMEFGSPLNQAFLIQGVTQLANAVIKQKELIIKQMENSAFNPHAWIKCAEDWLQELDTQQKFNNRSRK